MKSFTKATLFAVTFSLLAACERPPIEATQNGYRGLNMADISNPRDPEPELGYPAALPDAPSSGPRAGEVYENVQVLGDLSVAEFTRLMTAITAWVSPEQGCNYCHNPANLADDGIYTKVVSRRMIQMTQHINQEWTDHVGNNGVNCYTCHRGKNVPEYIWFTEGKQGYGNEYFMGWRNGQNKAGKNVGLASLPSEPFTRYLTSPDDDSVRVQPTSMFPSGEGGASFRKTEWTYALMMAWSQSLGVNCTYCHNSAAFSNWEQSTPMRITAHYGLNMTRVLNADYLIPLGPVYPDHRLGNLGDAPKTYCATCHQGVNKPLGGADAVTAYPSLK